MCGGDHFEHRVYSDLPALVMAAFVASLNALDMHPAPAISATLLFVLLSLPAPWTPPPTASGVDLAAIATACGIRTSRIVRTMAEVSELRDLAHEGRGTAFAQIKINPEALVFVMPPADGVILTSRFRQSVLGDEALFN